jgi:hypothetical protein
VRDAGLTSRDVQRKVTGLRNAHLCRPAIRRAA